MKSCDTLRKSECVKDLRTVVKKAWRQGMFDLDSAWWRLVRMDFTDSSLISDLQCHGEYYPKVCVIAVHLRAYAGVQHSAMCV